MSEEVRDKAGDYTLLRDYMNEHYAAPRHQQTLRVQSLALLSSASAVIFSQGILNSTKPNVTLVYGVGLLVIALVALLLNSHFHRANRYHVEVARRARKAISKEIAAASDELESPASKVRVDPNKIGEAVRLVFEEDFKHLRDGAKYQAAFVRVLNGTESKIKIERLLNSLMHLVPVLVAVGGIVLLGLNERVRDAAATVAHWAYRLVQ
jgi:hypothetical protein